MISIKDTADIRARILQVWKLVDERKISTAEARLHIGLARTILETLKVEIAAAHLTQAHVPPLSVTRKVDAVQVQRKQREVVQ